MFAKKYISYIYYYEKLKSVIVLYTWFKKGIYNYETWTVLKIYAMNRMMMYIMQLTIHMGVHTNLPSPHS